MPIGVPREPVRSRESVCGRRRGRGVGADLGVVDFEADAVGCSRGAVGAGLREAALSAGVLGSWAGGGGGSGGGWIEGRGDH
jgi:hypothetical protein